MDGVVEDVEKAKKELNETYSKVVVQIKEIGCYGKSAGNVKKDSLPRMNGLAKDGLALLNSLQFKLDHLDPQLHSDEQVQSAKSLLKSWKNQFKCLLSSLRNANLQAKANMRKAAQQERELLNGAGESTIQRQNLQTNAAVTSAAESITESPLHTRQMMVQEVERGASTLLPSDPKENKQKFLKDLTPSEHQSIQILVSLPKEPMDLNQIQTSEELAATESVTIPTVKLSGAERMKRAIEMDAKIKQKNKTDVDPKKQLAEKRLQSEPTAPAWEQVIQLEPRNKEGALAAPELVDQTMDPSKLGQIKKTDALTECSISVPQHVSFQDNPNNCKTLFEKTISDADKAFIHNGLIENLLMEAMTRSDKAAQDIAVALKHVEKLKDENKGLQKQNSELKKKLYGHAAVPAQLERAKARIVELCKEMQERLEEAREEKASLSEEKQYLCQRIKNITAEKLHAEKRVTAATAEKKKLKERLTLIQAELQGAKDAQDRLRKKATDAIVKNADKSFARGYYTALKEYNLRDEDGPLDDNLRVKDGPLDESLYGIDDIPSESDDENESDRQA